MNTKYAVFVDKPSGITTKNLLNKVKIKLGVKVAGYTGILDTKVSGMVLILFEESRKAIPFFMGLDKTYEGILYLHGDIKKTYIKKTCKRFVGEIEQIPPVKSRVSRKKRCREIYSFEIQKIEGRNVYVKIRCEAGTYIRKLFHDIGEELGCGAHMKFLRRVAIGNFTEMTSFEDLASNHLVLLEDILNNIGITKVAVQNFDIEKIKTGQKLRKSCSSGRVGIFLNDKIIAIGTSNEKEIKIDRVFKFD